jgi:hypothetical protein
MLCHKAAALIQRLNFLAHLLDARRLRLFKMLGLLFSLCLFIGSFWSSASRIDFSQLQIQWAAVFATITMVFLTLFTGIAAWTRVVCAICPEVTIFQAYSAYLLSTPAKYIPGLAWNHLGKVALLGHNSIKTHINGAAVVVLELMMTLITGLWITTLLSVLLNVKLPLVDLDLIYRIGLAVMFSVILLGLAVSVSLWLTEKRLQGGLHFMRVCANFVVTEIIQSVNWLFFGLAFWLASNAIHSLPLQYLPDAIISFSLSVIIGLVVFFAPNGIGIREAILMNNLSYAQPAYISWVASVLIRLLFIIAEMVGFLGILYAGRKRQMSTNTEGLLPNEHV